MNEKREGAKLVELLHLAFLQVLPSHLPVGEYAVKGGANLRLFYESRRSSQDIDLDYLFGTYPDAIKSGDVNRDLVKAAMVAALCILYESYEELVAEFLICLVGDAERGVHGGFDQVAVHISRL